MIFFDNDEKDDLRPKVFDSAEIARARKAVGEYLALSARERRQTDLPSVWKLPLDQSVTDALARWSKGRCAFCERHDVQLAPYRFRPPGYAEPMAPPIGKDAYIALCFAWSNFFPICPDCRPDKPSYFPVRGPRAKVGVARDPGLRLSENATLYFPGEVEEPALKFSVAVTGELMPSGYKAAETVAHFKLNRPELVEQREESLRRFIQEFEKYVGASEQEWLERLTGEPFAGAHYLFLRRLAKVVGEFGTVPRPRKLTPAGLQEVLLRWRERINLVQAFRTAIDTVRYEDEIAAARSLRPKRVNAPASSTLDARIAKVEIKTYKSLEKIEFELPAELARLPDQAEELSGSPPEAPCLLILGENATGKSSILEAIALACLSPDELYLLELKPTRLILNPQFMGTEREQLLDSEIRVTFHDGRMRRFSLNARPGARDPWHHSAEDEEDEGGPLVFAYGAHRLYGAKGARSERHFGTLFRNDLQLPNPEDWLRRLATKNPDALDEVVSALRYIIRIDGEFESIDFPTNTSVQPAPGMIRVRKYRPDGEAFVVSQPLSSVSSGYRAILAVVCDVFEGLFKRVGGKPREARMARAIVLIDEIEAHLHPRWKLQVIAGLRRALPRATFIVTSHDPLCLRGMYDGEVMALNRYQNVTGEGLELAERVEKIGAFTNVEKMTIEQLLTSDLFQLLSTDDRKTETEFARVADLLAEEDGRQLDPTEALTLERFRSEIGDALPFGRGEIPMLVQEAVAEFLRDRRQLSAEQASGARLRAKQAIKSHLKALLA